MRLGVTPNTLDSSCREHALAAVERAGMVAESFPFAGVDSDLVSTPMELSRERPTVLHFIYGVGGGGAESMMRSLVRGLDRRRWRVVVVAMQAEAWPDETEDLRRIVDVLHVLEETALLSGAALRKLHSVIRTEQPDVVQTWMHHADFTGGLVARFAGVKQVVWGIHCREITRAAGESRLKAGLFKRVMPLMAQWVPRRIVSCSQAALEDHVNLGYPTEKLTWIPNGVDTQRFRPLASAREEMREQLGLSGDAFVIGFAGRAHEMKNLALMLRAFGLLQLKVRSVRLVLCGVEREDLDDASCSIFKALPNQAAVSWLPYQREPENFYPALDVFSLSSRTEACPMTVLEAMSCGVPCVTTDVGDCAKLIGKTGAVVAADNADALAAAWRGAMEWNAEERSARGAAARERVVSGFSLERAVEGYQDLYETLSQPLKSS